MPRFFVDSVAGETTSLFGADAAHITRSLRMRPGEALTLCDGRGMDYHCEILSAEADEVALRVLESCPSKSEPSLRLTLFQALPKGDKMEFIVQKAVELGVCSIVPVLTEFCVSRPDSKKWEAKQQRYARVALEAAKQSGRGVIPTVEPLCSFSQALACMKAAGQGILLYEKAEAALSSVLEPSAGEISLMVGSEGGFSAGEAAQAREAGIRPALLGPRILRCETAPIAALSAVLYATGNL
ncbi:16S rRNA (uracil(1498)-N(3))-methyltransferase [Oscillospiraceae bacterium MB08-C2-2]|nr:16S rRNA (uracil(1498)-N(3))-methyltransferase [Oscillospiraceae bacterium MB08-C2-2]